MPDADTTSTRSTPPGADPTPRAPDFSRYDDPRRTRELVKIVKENPQGIQIMEAAREAWDADFSATDRRARRARFFFRTWPDLFETTVRNGCKWVEPTQAVFYLTARNTGLKPQDSADPPIDTGLECRKTGKEVTRSRNVITCDDTKGVLLQKLLAKRRATDDKFHWFTRNGSDHCAVPYRTRFNDGSVTDDSENRVREGFDRAAREYTHGQVWTLTTQTGRHTVAEATEELMDDVRRFRQWIAQRFNDGEWYDSIVVPEFTEKGMAHAHVVLFGCRHLPHDVVSHYWNRRRDRGPVVHYSPIRATSRDTWMWANKAPPDDTGQRRPGRKPVDYLTKIHRTAKAFAGEEQGDIAEMARALRSEATNTAAYSAGQRYWRLALYWLWDIRFATVGQDLKAEREPTAAKGWDYVGTCAYEQAPSHVRRAATIHARRPPPRPPPD